MVQRCPVLDLCCISFSLLSFTGPSGIRFMVGTTFSVWFSGSHFCLKSTHTHWSILLWHRHYLSRVNVTLIFCKGLVQIVEIIYQNLPSVKRETDFFFRGHPFSIFCFPFYDVYSWLVFSFSGLYVSVDSKFYITACCHFDWLVENEI